jgi:hypothetical protein
MEVGGITQVESCGSAEGGNGGREGGQGQGPGRKLPEGVHGAHGSFNRLQWRLDGRGVLVDELGRTESEAEEEERVERGGAEVDEERSRHYLESPVQVQAQNHYSNATRPRRTRDTQQLEPESGLSKEKTKK